MFLSVGINLFLVTHKILDGGTLGYLTPVEFKLQLLIVFYYDLLF